MPDPVRWSLLRKWHAARQHYVGSSHRTKKSNSL
ncbi:hypothetical protein L916_16097 [Phytophthora nicotianae]|uniref:Uncharacterized protein n=1 Tax=Phytophthora nicotianae TaxID=4792 RepID=W2ICA1_PHYNI|nr:hypothetical protein L916_16097 [Phytophthora nicotianae]